MTGRPGSKRGQQLLRWQLLLPQDPSHSPFFMTHGFERGWSAQLTGLMGFHVKSALGAKRGSSNLGGFDIRVFINRLQPGMANRSELFTRYRLQHFALVPRRWLQRTRRLSH